jgi:hypothetical protein
MKPETLLRLYPRAWRERYREEVLAMFGGAPLSLRQSIDLFAGAIDARFAAPRPKGEQPVTTSATFVRLKRACHAPVSPTPIKDGVVGAGIMIVVALAFAATAMVLRSAGRPEVARSVSSIAFPATLVFWADYMYLRRQPGLVRLLITGLSLAILLGSSLVALLL